MENINFSILRLLLAGGGLCLFGVMEHWKAYRPATVGRAGRWGTNLVLATVNNVLLTLIFGAILAGALAYHQTGSNGLLNLLPLPYGLKIAVFVIIYDFILYGWHRLNHTLPFLQRFHQVHHCDLNMDVSTAFRYHFGELAISMLIKAALILLTGVDPATLFIAESVLLACVQLHHSSIRVAPWLDAAWQLVFVPPAMHRIHHSVVAAERNSNYGAIFSFWDRVFNSYRRNVDQAGIDIGLPAYPDTRSVGFMALLRMPLQGSGHGRSPR